MKLIELHHFTQKPESKNSNFFVLRGLNRDVQMSLSDTLYIYFIVNSTTRIIFVFFECSF